MKRFFQIMFLISCFASIPFSMNAQEKTIPEKYQRFLFGSVKPSGWLKIQMQKDIKGFVGNLDRLVPDLINDPIYGSGRLGKSSKMKDLGNLKDGDAGDDNQYKWWNSESQSNWWDGYIRNVLLLNDDRSIEKVKKYISRILATQDDDGYLGIYDKDLRYQFTSENGELWSKTTLFRGLLAYYEYTQDPEVWKALVKAVDNVMENYPLNRSDPFNAGKDFSGGVAHGLTFTDILDRMYQLTGNKMYRDYALFLYLNYAKNYSSEKDAQLHTILDPEYKFQCHGVHTYEHLRPLIVAVFTSGNEDLQKALKVYLERIKNCTTQTGGPIGDEWIAGRTADATHTGYEYCSIQELLDSYTVLLQKAGNSHVADEIETIFYNAAQGSRNPDHSCIAYLKTDNSYEMMGTKNGEVEPGRKQTRYKYSPAHQDVAVCCNPNAGRITPYFLQSAWLKEGEHSLAAMLLMPNILETTIDSVKVKIENETNYPYQNQFTFKITLEKPMSFTLKIRKPAWVKSILTTEKYRVEDNLIVITRTFSQSDKVNLRFLTDVLVKEDLNHEKYFTYGALVFARSIPAKEIQGRVYAKGFTDLMYAPVDTIRYEYINDNKAQYRNGNIIAELKNRDTQETEKVSLIPFGKTILRQVSFRRFFP